MRRIDLDTINFEFGAWEIAPDQCRVLARIANGINRAADRNPGPERANRRVAVRRITPLMAEGGYR